MTYYSEPEEVTGYALDAEDSFWQVCLPQATRNLFKDPSFESGVAPNNGTLINTGMLGRQCVQSIFSGVSPNTNQIVNARFTTETTGVHTVSAHVRFVSSPFVRSIVIRVVNETVNPAVEISRDTHVITKRNQWVRISHTTRSALTAGTEYTLQIFYSTPSNTRVFQVDCVQAEALPYATTYVDGDMALYVPEAANEYYWEGTPYNSVSVRTGQTRTGGKLVSLDDYGFRTLSVGGLGLVPVERQTERRFSRYNESSNFSVGTREITITGTLYGETFGELSKKRVALTNLFSPSSLSKEDDPILLRIQLNDNDEPMDLMVRYVDGLEGEITNLHQQRISVRLTAIENPYLQGVYQSIVCNDFAGSTNARLLVKNLSTGQWTPYMYQASTEGQINDIYLDDNGDVYVCGNMTGAVHKLKALGSTNTQLGNNLSSTGGGAVTMAAARIGNELWIAVGGQMIIGGTAVAVALWRESTNTWTSVLTQDQIDHSETGSINDIVFVANTLYVGGKFVSTLANNAEALISVVILKDSNILSFTYGKPITFSTGAEVISLASGSNNKLYIAGEWVATSVTGESKVLIEENVITGETQSVLPPLSTGINFPQVAKQIVLDKNNRIYLMRHVSNGFHYLIYQGQSGSNLGQSIASYEDWSSNTYNLQTSTSNTGNGYSYVAVDKRNNLYISGPIISLDQNEVFNSPAMKNSVVSRVWSHNFKILATPIDAYYERMTFSSTVGKHYPIAIKGDWLAVATHRDSDNNLLWGSPTQVNNTSSVPASSMLLVTGPGDFIAFWNWTTGEQLVLDEPIILQNKSGLTRSISPYNLIGERIIIMQRQKQYMYRYLDVADSQWMLVPINVAGTTNNALMLAPGINAVTSYIGRRFLQYNPQINPVLVWRSQQGAL